MDILWTLLTLPYAPVRGLTAVLKVVQREAEAQLYSPANVRRELEELERAANAGEISEAELRQAQQRVVDRFTRGAPQAVAAGGGTRGPQPVRESRPRRPVAGRARRAVDDEGGDRRATGARYRPRHGR
ncbi:MAG TPA: gas vesicle protein GvpG [Micromonospora sp.]